MLDLWEQPFFVKYIIEFLEGEDEGNDNENKDDFLMTCLGCPHPDLRYQSSHPNLILNTQSSTGSLRGVCPCMAGGKCNPKDNHTANRHNNWVGL